MSDIGGKVTWKIKGSVTVSNLPANRNFTTTFKFQVKAKGEAGFVDFADINAFTGTGAGGSRTNATDYEVMKMPGKGDQYRFTTISTYDDANSPPGQIAVPAPNESNVLTPDP